MPRIKVDFRTPSIALSHEPLLIQAHPVSPTVRANTTKGLSPSYHEQLIRVLDGVDMCHRTHNVQPCQGNQRRMEGNQQWLEVHIV